MAVRLGLGAESQEPHPGRSDERAPVAQAGGHDAGAERERQPGAEVEFERDGEAVRVIAAGAAATRGLRGRYDASGMAAALLADRAREPR